MTLGLYQVGENKPIIRLRRGRAHEDPFARTHIAPDGAARREALCGARPSRGEAWSWGDGGNDCPACLSRARQGLRTGSLVLADPAVVAEFERRVLDHLDDRPAHRRRFPLEEAPEWTL